MKIVQNVVKIVTNHCLLILKLRFIPFCKLQSLKKNLNLIVDRPCRNLVAHNNSLLNLHKIQIIFREQFNAWNLLKIVLPIANILGPFLLLLDYKYPTDSTSQIIFFNDRDKESNLNPVTNTCGESCCFMELKISHYSILWNISSVMASSEFPSTPQHSIEVVKVIVYPRLGWWSRRVVTISPLSFNYWN